MRVLMFGWEFPPHIAGGLGTACYGIVKGLAYNGVETIFVMPSASGDEDQSAARIINASDVPVDIRQDLSQEFLDKVQFINVGTNMVPYCDPEAFTELVEKERRNQEKGYRILYGQKFKFSGKYGANLMEEVARYAMVGGTIAVHHKDEFDVIHAHDWLTYYAGIAAKQLTGKPLVIHVHATSFDRGSVDNIDTRVYEIERNGMLAADRVITVSDLTRNIVISKYGIDPAKVVTVHNAVDFSGRDDLVVERGVIGGFDHRDRSIRRDDLFYRFGFDGGNDELFVGARSEKFRRGRSIQNLGFPGRHEFTVSTNQAEVKHFVVAAVVKHADLFAVLDIRQRGAESDRSGHRTADAAFAQTPTAHQCRSHPQGGETPRPGADAPMFDITDAERKIREFSLDE